MLKARTIDMHAHFFPPIQEAEVPTGWQNGPWLQIENAHSGMIMTGSKAFRPVRAELWDGAARLAEMDRLAVDLQIICATPILFGYAQKDQMVADWAARINDMALEHCAVNPHRLKALAQVPLQNIELACREADRAKASGHIGIQIGNHVGDMDLDHEGLIEFLDHCGRQHIPVLVHPWDMMGAPRMKKWMLPWLVAMPAETQLSILSLILSGAFERLPQSLKICFAHGGGSFAFILPRVDNAWRQRDIVRQDCPNLPSSYVNRFYVDSAVFGEKSLRLLADVMGYERVMLGSDHPFPLGEEQIGALIRETPLFSDSEKSALLGLNAAHFFNLS